ncbi:Bro-N domain-containing protein, partial [Pectobacterium carotovorum]|uniref:BRO-N domain-containing protein n=1 Tax=Pectobacterium carotovorum TaxID=554 RepID=UPI002FFD815F
MAEVKHKILYPSSYGEVEIRTIDKDGRILFCFPDVVKVLAKDNINYTDLHGNTSGKKEGFRGLLSKLSTVLKDKDRIIVNLNDENEFLAKFDFYVTEAGLYKIITIDESEAAIRFQDWVFEEVLPSIRKFGIYPPPKEGASELSTLVSLLQQNVNLLAQEIEKREVLEQKVASIDSRVAQIEEGTEGNHMYSINEYLNVHNIDIENPNILWAWCEKIKIESGFDSKKSHSGHRMDIKYPKIVIEMAMFQINELP